MKFYRNSSITVHTECEQGVSYDVPADVEWQVTALGRGRWLVEDEDGYRHVLRTAALERFIRGLSSRYIGGYWSSGEPQYFISEVSIDRA